MRHYRGRNVALMVLILCAPVLASIGIMIADVLTP